MRVALVSAGAASAPGLLRDRVIRWQLAKLSEHCIDSAQIFNRGLSGGRRGASSASPSDGVYQRLARRSCILSRLRLVGPVELRITVADNNAGVTSGEIVKSSSCEQPVRPRRIIRPPAVHRELQRG